ncbi:40S ribosomal protein S15 [Trachipleistophora hominis]|uniref:40S ribosomal protein S15 n=1 Tax=Trachipleistophora hominis TaxID=72359 RepID=L7JUU1_TRAHO|nr:40S ribosomal protein S15 [Trachipleistophora hominis]
MQASETTKRRTFKKFTYQGVDLDDLKTMPLCNLKALLPSALRRHINRGFSEEEYTLIKQCERNEPDIKTKCRNMMILPVMIGQVVGVHNGCNFVEIDVKPEMIGRRFKDLVPTKTSKAHGRPGVGATSSSKFVPLK